MNSKVVCEVLCADFIKTEQGRASFVRALLRFAREVEAARCESCSMKFIINGNTKEVVLMCTLINPGSRPGPENDNAPLYAEYLGIVASKLVPDPAIFDEASLASLIAEMKL
jgi:hypothetical protein